jgi:hypothetical protein
VVVSILPPLSTEDLTKDRWEDIKGSYEDLFRREYARIRRERLQRGNRP